MADPAIAYAEPLLPPGSGYHTDLMRKANYAAILGMTPEDAFGDLRKRTPQGTRRILDREILDALRKAYRDRGSREFVPRSRPEPVVRDGEQALRQIIEKAVIHDEADLWEASPIRLMDAPERDAELFLETMFRPEDLLFIGSTYDTDTIRSRDAWIESGCDAPHIAVNPLSGGLAPNKAGDGQTHRGDNNVVAFRHCLVEFDNLSHEDQIRFWSAVHLPIKALVCTGGKSIHAWIDVPKLASVTTLEEWDAHIRRVLYDRTLRPLGADGACSNPSRLSRLPGHHREKTGKYQKILWLSSEGRPIT